eukprot:544670-Ditylum_brightwellii.AAC.1
MASSEAYTIDPSLPPLYIGLYVDNFVYFSSSPEVECLFCHHFINEHNMLVDFIGKPTQFLGLKLDTNQTPENVTIHLSQEACIDVLLENFELTLSNPVTTPFRSGYLVDSVPTKLDLPPDKQQQAIAFIVLSGWFLQLAYFCHIP